MGGHGALTCFFKNPGFYKVGRLQYNELIIYIFNVTFHIQSTPDNLNLQGKSKKVRVIGSSKKIAESKVKNSFYCTVNNLNTFNCRNVT